MKYVSLIALAALLGVGAWIWATPRRGEGGQRSEGASTPTTAAVAGGPVLGLAAAPGADAPPFDVLRTSYAPYCVAGDDLAFPMKVWGLSGPKYKFWRGSRDLYFRWCRDNAQDWLRDEGAYALNHGDLHLGNIGTYVRDGGALGATSFGPVDFDETARLPFQIELLQGLITLRLAARENNIELAGGRRDELARAMFDSYREAIRSDKNTRELVSDEQQIGKFIEQTRRHSYDATLEKFVRDGAFRPFITTGKREALKEILRPARDRADDLARGIAQSLQNSAAARGAFRYSDVETIRRSIKDVALRTRLESVGSQGLKKYLVLMERPLKGLDMDVVLYLKQEIPSAAERAGAIAADPRSPGRRCSEDMAALTNPTAYLNTWCDVRTESYWVSFKEPWSEEMDVARIAGFQDLLADARVWGKVAGAMHRLSGRPGDILRRLDRPELFDRLRQRGTQYMAELDREHSLFTQDPRARAEAAKAQGKIDVADRAARAQE